MKNLFLFLLCFLCFAITTVYLFPAPILTPLANFLIADDQPEPADAVVVLNTGMGIYERLMEAANLYNQKYVDKIIINGNRKNLVLKELENMGLQHSCSWNEESIQILELLGVPRQAIISIAAEDVYDTMTEAQTIGPQILSLGLKKVIITTSKTHSARAIHIWRNHFGQYMSLSSVIAQKDPFDKNTWWKDGKHIKFVLYEYGSWLYYLWQAKI
jgi:uncharacterized SAM-binding protein YcdF (DUF218 family)